MISRLAISYISLIVIFVGLLFIVCLIPSNSIEKNIALSLKTLQSEGTYPSVGLPHRKIVLDNFTDTLMLNTAYSVDSRKPFESVVTNKRYSFGDGINQALSLEKGISKETNVMVGYERYWHGYLIYARPLLTVFSHTGIRIFLSALSIATLLAFLYLSWRKLSFSFAVILILSLTFVDFFFLGKSLQFLPVFIIGFCSALYILLNHDKKLNLTLVFFIVGGLTAYFDLLTAPLVALSIPLVTTIEHSKAKIAQIIKLCFFWSVGYVSLWASKWLLAALTYSPNAIQSALDQILNRTITKADVNFSHFNTIKLNVFQLIGYDSYSKKTLLILFLLFCIFILVFRKTNIKTLKDASVWFFIALIPYIWFFAVANHSYLHVWYTYRIQFLSVFGFLMGAVKLVNWEQVKALKAKMFKT